MHASPMHAHDCKQVRNSAASPHYAILTGTGHIYSPVTPLPTPIPLTTRATVLTLKALLEVRLYVEGVLGLAQDLQQVVARQEVEARELLPLILQVVLQALLDLLKLGIHVLGTAGA